MKQCFWTWYRHKYRMKYLSSVHSSTLYVSFSLPRSKCCNLIGWWNVKISWSWHFEVPRRTMVCVLLRETASLLTFIVNVISVNFIALFRIICWFLQTFNYRGNEKYVLVLVQCHDGMITNSINLVCVLHWSWTRANRFILFVIIAS